MEEKPAIVIPDHQREPLQKAAELIREADAILINTGAGMGVGSGLGTFRGPNAGVWPPLIKMNIDFSEMSNPKWFQTNPHLAWAFWHFRYTAYTGAEPHDGYHILKKWAESKPSGGFAFTSNIDGHWKRCGFPENKIIEVHGALSHLQCTDRRCGEGEIWPTPHDTIIGLKPDGEKDEMLDPLPSCTICGKVARPNVLMFEDWGWHSERYAVQEENYTNWFKEIEQNGAKLVIIEIGAGKAVPTVRRESEMIVSKLPGSHLIRINPVMTDSKIPGSLQGGGHIAITLNGEVALIELDKLVNSSEDIK
eukprot:TRINITY_DN10288_c0_g1_i1.p1 TRINITY_DN10288_c0_g1~~TRINITY_DN10288_c0_g1_i1.p1  ORF type:complete len:307 (+),score=70.76 TRINITY_DN10288_c0_g1_i1:166-1086(+)